MKKRMLFVTLLGLSTTAVGVIGLSEINASNTYFGDSIVYADAKQTVTTDYIQQDFQAIQNAIQNSSDGVRTDERLINAYTSAVSHPYTAYDELHTHGYGYEADTDQLNTVSIADVLHDLGKYDGLPYYINHGGVKDSLDVAKEDRNGAQYIYDRFVDRLSPADKLSAQTVWNQVQKDNTSDSIEDDLVSFYQAINDGIVQWGETIAIKSDAKPNALYTIKNNKKSRNQFIALYIPNNMVKKVIKKSYREFKRNKRLIINGNYSSYVLMNLFNTYNSGNPDTESSDSSDGLYQAQSFDENYVGRFGGKTTYNQGVKFFKKAYKSHGNYGVVIKGYFYNHRRPTMRLKSWDGYVTSNNIQLKYHPIAAY